MKLVLQDENRLQFCEFVFFYLELHPFERLFQILSFRRMVPHVHMRLMKNCLHTDNGHQNSVQNHPLKLMEEDVNIPIGETDEFWYRDDLVVIDVRERQEHVVSDIPCTADVINVPVTEVIQFIHDHQTLKERDIICVCRSGNRSAVVANVLQRHGFKRTRHLMGGLALLSSPAAKAV